MIMLLGIIFVIFGYFSLKEVDSNDTISINILAGTLLFGVILVLISLGNFFFKHFI